MIPPPSPPPSPYPTPFDRLSRKRFGQHWLINEPILNSIVAAANLQPSDRVLEIGPGTGSLTQRILPHAQSLVSVEIDRDICKLLRQHFSEAANFVLLEQDILTTDLQSSLTDFPTFQNPNKVVANIPYNITGPILEKLLGKIASPNPQPFESIVLLLQKEVAERICASPHSRAFGALTVRVQYLAAPEWICPVPSNCFHPKPKVDSAVVRLVPRVFEPAAQQPKQLETYVKLGFATKRKMLRNNLKSLVERDRLTALLEALQLDPQVRAEDLSVTDWVNLSNQLSSQGLPGK